MLPQPQRSSSMDAGIQWFNTRKQPVMIVVWTQGWLARIKQSSSTCYLLLQGLQCHYIPKWQIFVERDDDFPTMILKWKYPSTMWDGQPVLGFVAESDFKDAQGDSLQEVSFADFNPMWSFPPTAVKSNYDNITFGMDASHLLLRSNPPHAKDALTAQSPIVVFKASTVLQWNHCQSNSSPIF